MIQHHHETGLKEKKRQEEWQAGRWKEALKANTLPLSATITLVVMGQIEGAGVGVGAQLDQADLQLILLEPTVARKHHHPQQQ